MDELDATTLRPNDLLADSLGHVWLVKDIFAPLVGLRYVPHLILLAAARPLEITRNCEELPLILWKRF